MRLFTTLFLNTLSVKENSLVSKENFILSPFQLNILVLGTFLLLLLFIYFQFKKFKSLDRLNLPVNKTALKLNPAQIGTLIKGNFQPEQFILATILDWERRGILNSTFENKLNSKGKERRNYIFKKTNPITTPMSKDEKFLYDNIFKFGDGDSFSTENLNSYRKKSPNEFNEFFNKYLNLIKSELVEKGLLFEKSSNFTYSIFSALFSIIALSISIYALISTKIALINILFSIMLFILSTVTLFKRPTLGKEQFNIYNKIYQSMLNKNLKAENFSKGEREKIIIYAVSFSINYNDIEKLGDDLNIDKKNFIPIFWSSPEEVNIVSTFNRALLGNPSGSRQK
ncbi:DUF2207 family protein [Anaerosphaera multitolerans]|uniref:DUF2207 domain-containing protein n=1 Tax=Anaerosphaera multitolerans TaxID=2487351 RepID=A0A437S6G1_9FIRM|nr:DUF2207 domain-containing protein [Anaerosphaera multitolerans]RVU54588.1 DUF2207 domain-containing protein [Anaerosphaera multitolerans]